MRIKNLRNLRDFALAGYSGTIVYHFVLLFCLLRGNGILLQMIQGLGLGGYGMILQFAYLLLIFFMLQSKIKKSILPVNKQLTFSKRAASFFGSWLGMLGISLVLGYLRQNVGTIASNQESLVSLLNQVPVIQFILYLVIGSILEEFTYREVLFGLSGIPLLDMWTTSALFAFLHTPDNLYVFATYFVLGMFLANERYKRGLLSSIFLHILWNLTVLFSLMWK